MNIEQFQIIEQIQRLIVKTLAVNPAGYNLLLIGGYRYRFLNESVRRSADIDYHWDGDSVGKQQELISLFKRKLLPEVKRRFGYGGNVSPGRSPNTESEQVKIVELAFYREGVPYSRIEIPVDITRIARLDPPEVRTSEGIIYPTVSDADLIESKILALFDRVHIQARDFLDVFLFRSALHPEAPARMAEKMKLISLTPAQAAGELKKVAENREVHVKAIEKLIEEQLEPGAAAHIKSAGGAAIVFANVLDLLGELSRKGGGEPP